MVVGRPLSLRRLAAAIVANTATLIIRVLKHIGDITCNLVYVAYSVASEYITEAAEVPR